MNYVDLLQELGRSRRALEDLISSTTGVGTKDLLHKRDAITWAMNRVAEERVHLATLDVTAATAALDDIATKFAALPATNKKTSSALTLADKATGIIAGLFGTRSVPPAEVNSALTLAPKDRGAGAAAPLAAPAAVTSSVADNRMFTAFCNTHNTELPPTRVAFEQAMQNEDDHKASPGNANDDVDIIVVK